MEGVDKVIFDRLRTLRRLMAERHQVAPYMIFHDATLHQMAATQPADLAAMRTIKGVGESKLAHYGQAFLKVLGGMDPTVAAAE
jgi:ATP-dependent DNA helicase RecQ